MATGTGGGRVLKNLLRGDAEFRHGQWVKFKPMVGVDLDGAARDASGEYVIGIYQRAGTDGTGGVSPEQVVVVRPDGRNLSTVRGDEVIHRITFAPGECSDLRPVVDVKDIPAERLAANPGWKPVR